jgi:hypothetical protein
MYQVRKFRLLLARPGVIGDTGKEQRVQLCLHDPRSGIRIFVSTVTKLFDVCNDSTLLVYHGWQCACE